MIVIALESAYGGYGRAALHRGLQGLAEIPSTGELAVYVNDIEITKSIGGLSWKNSIYELAVTLSFEAAKTDNAYLKDLLLNPALGDIVRMVTNVEVFRGVIVKIDDGDINKNKYMAVDLGWYLNKTSQTYQFKNITVSDAIREICADLSISIDSISDIPTRITQIYFDKAISDIIKDLISQAGGDYNYDFTPWGLRVYKIGELVAYPEFRLASNLTQHYSPNYKGSVSHSVSIEEMKNSIKVVSEKDSVYKELMTLQYDDKVSKYGFLQKVVKIDVEKENAEVVANSELWANGREKESFSFEIIEKYDSYTRAGEVIYVDDVPYVIESTDHSYKDGWHFDKLELRKTI